MATAVAEVAALKAAHPSDMAAFLKALGCKVRLVPWKGSATVDGITPGGQLLNQVTHSWCRFMTACLATRQSFPR